MADIFAAGWEPGDTTEFTSDNESPTVVTSPVHCGSYACSFNSSDEECRKTVASLTTAYARVYVRFNTLPGDNEDFSPLQFWGNAGTDLICQMKFNKYAGTLKVYLWRYYPSSHIYSVNYTFAVDTWYCVEMGWYRHASAGWYKLWINGALLISKTGLDTTGIAHVDEVRVGQCTSSYGVIDIVDDVVVATSYIGTHDQSLEETFEGDFSRFDAQTDSPTLQVLNRHCGIQAMRCSVAQYGSAGVYVSLGHEKELYVQLMVEFDTVPGADTEYIEFLRLAGSGVDLLSLRIRRNAGAVEWGMVYREGGASTTAYSSGVVAAPVAGTWYCVEARLRCSPENGSAIGVVDMWIDDVELNDIDDLAVDTDYTGATILYLVTTTNRVAGAIVYTDCVLVQTTTTGACHVAGSEDVVPPITETADCEPPEGDGYVRVYRNCNQIELLDFSLGGEYHGVAELGLPYDTAIAIDDLVHVLVGGYRLVQGRVQQIAPDKLSGVKTIYVKTKTAQLYDLYVDDVDHIIYTGLDAGEIAKDLLDHYYGSLFTSENVDVETGFIISDIDGSEQILGEMLEELAMRAGASFYVDTDKDLHFYVEGDESTLQRIGVEDVLELTSETVGEPINRIIVKGDGVEGSAGSGVPEKMYSDRRIKSDSEAAEVAASLLARYGSGTMPRRTTIRASGFIPARRGQSLVLDYPDDGYDEAGVIVRDMSWHFGAGSFETTIIIGDEAPTIDSVLRNMAVKARQQEINRISQHAGGDNSDADPALIYETLINNGGLATAVDDTAEVTLNNAPCVAVAGNAATLAEIQTVLTWSADGGITNIHVYIGGTADANRIDSRAITPDADNTSFTITLLVARQLIALEIVYIRARCVDGGGPVTLTATLLVKQFLEHSHSATQSSSHDFD